MRQMPVSWGNFSAPFLDELSAYLRGKRVLEVFAGNGLLAKGLAEREVDIRSTSLFSGIDGHDQGMHFSVERIEASAAVDQYGSWADALLMSWPPANEAAAKCVSRWGEGREVIFIGEMTRPDLGFAGLGGCGSDLLFSITRVHHRFASYAGRGFLDVAVSLRMID